MWCCDGSTRCSIAGAAYAGYAGAVVDAATAAAEATWVADKRRDDERAAETEEEDKDAAGVCAAATPCSCSTATASANGRPAEKSQSNERT